MEDSKLILKTLTSVVSRLDSMDTRLDSMDKRFDSIDKQLVSIANDITEIKKFVPINDENKKSIERIRKISKSPSKAATHRA